MFGPKESIKKLPSLPSFFAPISKSLMATITRLPSSLDPPAAATPAATHPETTFIIRLI